MAQSTTVEYESSRCGHVNSITFDAGTEPFTEKTRGCNSCGKTSQFTKVNADSDNGGDNGETDSENDVVQDERTEEQESESIDMDVTDMSYQTLRSVAARIDSVETNQSHDELLSDLRDVDDSTLDSAITEVNNDE